MKTSRRIFIKTFGAAGAAAMLVPARAQARPWAERTFHLAVSTDALEADPELLEIVAAAGVTDVWIAGFLYGHWYYPLEKIRGWRERIEKQGMAAHLINVPLGHPGDSLGSMSGQVPLDAAAALETGRAARRPHLLRHLAARAGHGRELRGHAADPGGGRQSGVSRRRLSPGPQPRHHRRLLLPRTQEGVPAPHRLRRSRNGANCSRPSPGAS